MTTSFNHDDPSILWIGADAPDVGCTGTFENPYSTIETALDRVKPGQTIVLTRGEYVGDCNIQRSGTPRNPIRIVAEEPGKVIISKACWFFYDTSDLIVSGLTFVQAPHGALTLIGTCNRNRFDSLRFIDCGNRADSGCTFYMGGAGGGCNVIEECSFEMNSDPIPAKHHSAATVALMIARGDVENSKVIVDDVIRRNTFAGYDYGIIAGNDESPAVRCGHVIEYNRFDSCTREGIIVKSGDVTVKGNLFSNCTGHAITVRSDLDCTVEDNRVIGAATGIILQGKGHTVANNCLIRCTATGIHVQGTSESAPAPGAALNCFIEHNSIIRPESPDSDSPQDTAAILIDTGTSGILQQNLIAGHGKPYIITADNGRTEEPTHFIMKDNGITTGCAQAEGTVSVAAEFTDASADDYGTDGTYGASGWVVRPECFDPHLDDAESGSDYRDDALFTDENGELHIPGEDDADNPFGKYISNARQLDDESGHDEMQYWYPDE